MAISQLIAKPAKSTAMKMGRCIGLPKPQSWDVASTFDLPRTALIIARYCEYATIHSHGHETHDGVHQLCRAGDFPWTRPCSRSAYQAGTPFTAALLWTSYRLSLLPWTCHRCVSNLRIHGSFANVFIYDMVILVNRQVFSEDFMLYRCHLLRVWDSRNFVCIRMAGDNPSLYGVSLILCEAVSIGKV